MAILKHVAGKSADYGAALDYLKYEHDEVLKKPLLDANGNWVLRRDILLDGINCEPELFDVECEMLNAQYHKNQNYDEIKTHHISSASILRIKMNADSQENERKPSAWNM